ncbi:MAG: hypothetical protein GWP05_05940 [Anaerolineaceae bacterium]|nr:hypothetical protein [Anaerolineaceae bacterium]
MAGRKRKVIRSRDLKGLKYFRALSGLVEHLHEAGCARDRAGNRRLHMDQYVLLLLLEMFNPICDSLRSLQRASQLAKVQRKLGVPRVSLGSLSEAARVFDSDLLVEIIHALGQELEPIESGRFREDLGQVVTLVDSTLLTALPKTARALWFDPRHKGVKAHMHYELLKGLPTRCTLTDSKGNEKADSHQVATHQSPKSYDDRIPLQVSPGQEESGRHGLAKPGRDYASRTPSWPGLRVRPWHRSFQTVPPATHGHASVDHARCQFHPASAVED